MKKIFCITVFLITVFLFGCSNEPDNFVEVKMNLDVYELVAEGNILTFEYSETINIESTYEIVSIEELLTGFGEFPYESHFINEKDFSKYLDGIEDYLTQISANSITDSMPYMLISNAKLKVVLSNGNSDISIEFFQNESNEISGSMISYTDYQNIDFKHYFSNDDDILYTEINKKL
jgi:hypothetical protein